MYKRRGRGVDLLARNVGKDGNEYVTKTVRRVFQMQRVRDGCGMSEVLRSEYCVDGFDGLQEERGHGDTFVSDPLSGAGLAERGADLGADPLHGDAAAGLVRYDEGDRHGFDGLWDASGPAAILPAGAETRFVQSTRVDHDNFCARAGADDRPGDAERRGASPVQNQLCVWGGGREPGGGGLSTALVPAGEVVRYLPGGGSGDLSGDGHLFSVLRGADGGAEPRPLDQPADAGPALRPYHYQKGLGAAGYGCPDGGAGYGGYCDQGALCERYHPGDKESRVVLTGVVCVHQRRGGGVEGVQLVQRDPGSDLLTVGLHILVENVGGDRPPRGDYDEAAQRLPQPLENLADGIESLSLRGRPRGRFHSGRGALRGRRANLRGVHLRGAGKGRRHDHFDEHKILREQSPFQSLAREQRDLCQDQVADRGNPGGGRWTRGGGGSFKGRGGVGGRGRRGRGGGGGGRAREHWGGRGRGNNNGNEFRVGVWRSAAEGARCEQGGECPKKGILKKGFRNGLQQGYGLYSKPGASGYETGECQPGGNGVFGGGFQNYERFSLPTAVYN
nr:TPA_asm: M56A ORF [Murid betaherpesvirus 1]DBA08009.1 TPA_asm: M56A ORF [Murid betaherpesvirus 1]